MKSTDKQVDANEVKAAIISLRNALDKLEGALGKDW